MSKTSARSCISLELRNIFEGMGLILKGWSLQYTPYLKLQPGSQSVTIQKCTVCDHASTTKLSLTQWLWQKASISWLFCRIRGNTVSHTYICHIQGHNPWSRSASAHFWSDHPLMNQGGYMQKAVSLIPRPSMHVPQRNQKGGYGKWAYYMV